MSDIIVRNISYAYLPPQKALDNVSFHIRTGSFCGIIGPNGSGKTTLLRCISGYLTPDEGGVLIDDNNISCFSVREIARRMALVQQHASLEYDFTVMDIVLTGRNPYMKRLRGETRQDYAIANSALEKAGILHLKDRIVTTLSGGEWQRMILARALCQQADILLLDEPVTGLDIRHQVTIMSAAKRLAANQGISVVCVLHDLNLAYSYCDQIVLLKNGAVFAEGEPADVLTKINLETVYETKINIIRCSGGIFILPVMSS
ncbi:MAG: ABC transporter ATP-binding protein [Christensenellales bacterium]|jgi:iron complex transport system ATP-binding protein